MAAPTTIARYEILNRIGRGGMGALYLARDPKIDRLVAIKVLHADLEGDDMRIRFDREARSAGAMNHPNIVTIFDYGVFEDSPYIVMEYLRGETLAEVIKRKAPMPLRDKLSLLEQLCRGLAYAHEAGIIHRDIKPANLMIDQHGVLKILDFGIARLAESGLTQMSTTIGTPGYMSPEQIDGRHVERASDVFAVGAVAYELLTYKAAFGGDSQNAIIYNVLHTTPEPILSLVPDVGAGVAAIVTRALEKATTARYEDAASLQADFQAAREALGRTLRVPRNTPVSRPVAVPSLTETPTRLARSMPDVQPDPGKSFLDSARIAHSAGEFSRALDLVDRMLESEPANAEALELQKQIEDAKVDELLGKARVGLLGQRLTEATDLVGRALKIRPKSEAALKMQADLDSRRTVAEKKSGGRARARAAVERGRKYIKDGAWDAARRAADEAWALDPENADAVELIAAAEAGQAGGGPATFPGMDLLGGATEPMHGKASTTAVQISVPMSAMAIPATAPMAGPTPSAVNHAPRRGAWMLVVGLGGVGVAVAAVILLNQQATPVAPPPVVDTTKPVAVLVSPSAGEPVKGLVKIKAAANDDVGVVGVTIKVDGVAFPELKAEPYEVDWKSTDLPDGQHTISVQAADAAGHLSTPATATVTINNTAHNTPSSAPNNAPNNVAPPVTPSKPQVPRPEPFPGANPPATKLSSEDKASVSNWLAEADKNVGDGKYELALALIGKALAIDPSNPSGLKLQKEAQGALAAEKLKKGRGGGGH